MRANEKNIKPILHDEYTGHVDNIDNEWISGWIFNNTQPETRIKVQIYIESDLIGEGYNDYERQDISILYNISRPTGFRIKINQKYLSNKHKEIKIIAEKSMHSIKPIDDILTKKNITIKLTEESYLNLNNANKLIDALSENINALITLNNNINIQAKVDPGLGNIYIINGAKSTTSELFRTYELANALRKLCYSPLIFEENDIIHISSFRPIAVFFIRTALSDTIKNYIRILQSNKIKCIADFDDLIFKPSIFHKIDGIRYLDELTKKKYFEGIYQYKSMIEIADYVTTSTEYLTEQAKELNFNAATLSNYPLTSVRKKIQRKSIDSTKKRNDFIIGYYSGTLTHQADFKQCVSSIVKILAKYENIYLKIVGKFDIEEFEELSIVNNKIRKIDFMPYEEMVLDIKECSVVIAPLEIGNEFCESKSELKYFDAALVGVPLIASATKMYVKIIENQKNGYLAKNNTDWYNILEELYFNPQSLKEVGKNAKIYVEKNYSESKQKINLKNILDKLEIKNIIENKIVRKKVLIDDINKNKNKNFKKSICVLLPDIFIGSGGHRKVLTFCEHHIRNNGKVEINFITNKSEQELKFIIKEYFFENCGDIKVYNGCISDFDIAIATSWPTAYEVIKWSNINKKYYFVQDFEPLFSPMSTNYVKSLHSYRLGLNLISFGHWNSSRLMNELNLKSDIVEFPIEKEVYFPRYYKRKKQILFYARPSQPRRLYELGLEALTIARPFLSDYEFLFFGEEIDLNGFIGVINLGKITDIVELANIYSLAEIGISFSTTNPSLIPFEMLACGLPVIDVNLGGTNKDFENCESILRANPTPFEIAKLLVQTLNNTEYVESLSRKAIEWTSKLDDNNNFSNKVLKLLGV